MHLSLNWLRDHVDLSGLAPETIAHELTMRSALIEGIHDQAAQLVGVVVGEVVTCGKHPEADRLSLTRVRFADGEEPVEVVCGAPNVAAGQKIVYAPVGTRLPNGLKLKKAKIRGQPSHGMICAEDEIGLGPEHDGTLELDTALAVGTPIGEVPGLCDVILEIDNKSVTHRPDLWGHYGFARELAAIFGRELKPLELDASLTRGEAGPGLELAAGDGCPLYLGYGVEDEPARSPEWLRRRLVACGMRPIQLSVDLSNYVMLELGQPTHPFDRDRLAGDRIVVRPGRAGETLKTLDDETRTLGEGDVVIADGERGVAIGGIMGSADAEVSESTRRVFLESASFHPATVRRTSSRLGLRTEALARFEKELDPGLTETAIRRYAALYRALRPEARLDGHFQAVGEARAPERVVALEGARVRRLLGTQVEDAEVVAALEALGFGVRETAPGRWDVDVPSWRTRDVQRTEDLVEEVGRVVGYQRVPDDAPRGPLRVAERDPRLVVEERARDALAGAAGFCEVLSYSTIPDRVLAQVGWDEPAARRPRLANALQQDAASLRPSPAPVLVERLEAWLRHDAEARAFEVGRGYVVADGDGPDGTGVAERRQIVALYGSRQALDARDVVRSLRGVADVVFDALALERPTAQRCDAPADEPWFHPQRVAELRVGDRQVGRVGAVDPGLLARLDVQGAAGLLVLEVDALVACERVETPYAAVSRQPPAHMDLAFVASYDVTSEAIQAALRKAGPKTLRAVEPFDVYRGKPLAEDQRSVAFHLVFQAQERTLTDAELAKARDKMVRAVEQLGASLR